MGVTGETTVRLWEQSMRGAGRSERTIAERLRVVRAAGVDPMTATVFDIEAWLGEHPGWARSTRRSYVDALRAFFHWMHARGLRADDPTLALQRITVPRGVPKPITTGELQLLLDRARTWKLRGYLLLGALAGLRVHEIAKVRGEDVRDGRIRVEGKGGVTAVIPMPPALAEYAQARPASGWWFPSGDGHVTGNNVSRVVSDHMRRCGVDATAHCLRHWLGTELVAEGVQIRVVQKGLRHANLQTTQIYTDVCDEQLAAAFAGLPRVA